MKTNNLLKISIATGVVHALSAITALVFYLILKFSSSGMEEVAILVLFLFFIAIFAGLGLVICIIQFIFGAVIIVTGALKKKKLCNIFCGLSLVVDVAAAVFGVMFGYSFISSGGTGIGISIGIDLLLMGVLSIAGFVLSIITIVKNKSQTSEDLTTEDLTADKLP